MVKLNVLCYSVSHLAMWLRNQIARLIINDLLRIGVTWNRASKPDDVHCLRDRVLRSRRFALLLTGLPTARLPRPP